MRRVEWDIEKQGLLRIMLADPSRSLLSNERRAVALFAHRLAIAMPIQPLAGWVGRLIDLVREVIDPSPVHAIRIVESAVLRKILGLMMPQMPLAGDRGAVARLPKRRRQHPLLQRQTILRREHDDM